MVIKALKEIVFITKLIKIHLFNFIIFKESILLKYL